MSKKPVSEWLRYLLKQERTVQLVHRRMKHADWDLTLRGSVVLDEELDFHRPPEYTIGMYVRLGFSNFRQTWLGRKLTKGVRK